MRHLKIFESDKYYDEVNSYWKTVQPSIEYFIFNKNEVDSIKSTVKSTNGRWILSNARKTLWFRKR